MTSVKIHSGPTSCAHKWGQYTPALISTHPIKKYPTNRSYFLSHCGSYTGENHSRKICLRRISAWLCPLECHGMEGIEAAVDTKSLGNIKKVFAKSCGNPDFRSIFGHQRAKNEGTNTKIDRGPETYPISINPRDEMNRADSFREKLRKPRFSVNFWSPEGQKWGHEHENR